MSLYGIPYMGSKTGIAEDLIAILPKGERFVDLFGGGFAMTHCALLSSKWKSFLYNEINPLLVELIRKGINGDYNYDKFKPEFITREKFAELKDVDGYVKYIWSFGNKGDAYLFGKDIEEQKHAFHDAVVFGKMDKACEYIPELKNMRGRTIKDRRLSYNIIVRGELQRNDLQQLQQLERLQQLEQLERLQQLERLERLQQLERLELVCGSYLDFAYGKGDVVYCDPPYEGTAEYDGGFNHKEFYDWVASRPYRVYFSSYEISDKRFFRVWEKRKLSTLSGSSNRAERVEVLYSNQEDRITLF